jgi:ABC-2 type transport system permease protein
MLHAEWTKLRTVAGTGWLLLASVVLTVGATCAAAEAVTYDFAGTTEDTTKLSLSGVELGQAVIAILAVVALGSEYGTGMIRATLAAMPHRGGVLAAKAAVILVLVLVAATIAVLGCLLAGRLILAGNGFTAAHGYSALSLAYGPTLRAAFGTVVYLALIALLSLGIAAAVRDSAAAIGVVLGLLYLFPVLVQVVTDPHWQRHLRQIAPMDAGLAIQKTVGLHGQPLSPWAGLGVLACWAGAALLAGAVMLQLRDA